MINPDFIKTTDQIISQIKKRNVRLENGNVLVAKVKVDRMTKGGLILAEDHAQREDYHNGLSRILALPSNLGLSEGDAKLQIGDYILHSHEARYRPHPEGLREMLDMLVDNDFIFVVQDSEVLMSLSPTDS